MSHTAVAATISSPMPNTCGNLSAPVRKVKFPCPLCEHVSQNEPKRITHLDHKHPDWVTESVLARPHGLAVRATGWIEHTEELVEELMPSGVANEHAPADSGIENATLKDGVGSESPHQPV